MAQLYIAGGNALPGSGDPTTVVGQTGLNQEIVLYVADAYRDVQNAQEQWNFKRRRGFVTLPAGKRTLSIADIQAEIPDYESIQPDLMGAGYRYLLFSIAQGPYSITGDWSTFNAGLNAPPYFPVGENFFFGGGPVSGLYDGTVVSFDMDDTAQTINMTFDFANPDVLGSGLLYVGARIYVPGAGPYFNIKTLDGYAVPSGGISQNQCDYATYQDWRGNLDRGVISTGAPYLYTIQPNGTIEFNAVSTNTYTITIDYYTSVVNWVRAATTAIPNPDTQTPIFPSRYHEIVAWGAVMKWSAVRESSGKYGFAKNNYDRVMNDLCVNELPETQLCINQFYSPYSIGAYGW